jgi:serine/threonine protein kinase
LLELGSEWTQALRARAVFGRFELVRESSQGGDEAIWEAWDREVEALVAFKAIRLGRGPDWLCERLLAEARIAARLRHANLVAIHSVEHSPYGPFLAMELLRGEGLDRRLDRGPIACAAALGIGMGIARGLSHAHNHGLAHGGLTPRRVFLCEDGTVKLLGLCTAHALGRWAGAGRTPYRAPEQWQGAPEDERSDVFALGVLLHRMVAGRLPFRPEPGRAWRSRAQMELGSPQVPGLGAVLKWMLEPDPVARPRDGLQAMEALAELQRAPGIARSPRAQARRARRLTGRLCVAAVAAAGALGAAGFVAARASDRAGATVATAPSVGEGVAGDGANGNVEVQIERPSHRFAAERAAPGFASAIERRLGKR